METQGAAPICAKAKHQLPEYERRRTKRILKITSVERLIAMALNCRSMIRAMYERCDIPASGNKACSHHALLCALVLAPSWRAAREYASRKCCDKRSRSPKTEK